MAKVDLLEYFNEHVLYELQMLRYSKNQLGIPIKTPDDQYHWNCMFAAFNVSARNLYKFLKGDPDNISITDYNKYRKTLKSPNVSGISLGKINDQCFHMGSSRTKAPQDKVTYQRIVKMFDWVELNAKRMFTNFKEEFRAAIKWEKANWYPIPAALTNAIGQGPTGSGEGLVLRIPTPTYSATTATPGETYSVNTFYPTDTKKPLGP